MAAGSCAPWTLPTQTTRHAFIGKYTIDITTNLVLIFPSNLYRYSPKPEIVDTMEEDSATPTCNFIM